ncbi:MAG: hypothetical protein AB7T49_08395 [Oligoflexales bacterium]
MKITHVIAAASSVFLFQCKMGPDKAEIKEAWNSQNNPALFNVTTAKLEALPTEGSMPTANYPWTDDYWGHYAGGIANRWQYGKTSRVYRDYEYEFVTKEDILAGKVDINKLSPAEKYDLWLGNYDFPLAKSEWRNSKAAIDPATGEVPTWWGICNGWAPASAREPEPAQIAVVTNPDGIPVTFYNSDMKALLSKAYAYRADSDGFIGQKCDEKERNLQVDANGRVVFPACRDTNPAAMHLVLAKYLGATDATKRRAFVMDVTRSQEIWNQPITGFKVTKKEVKPFDPATDPMAQYRAPGTKSVAYIKADVLYVGEVMPRKTPSSHLYKGYVRTAKYEYSLELDGNGVIIGGEWISKAAPDFMWKVDRAPDSINKRGRVSYEQARKLADISRRQAAQAGPSDQLAKEYKVQDGVLSYVHKKSGKGCYIYGSNQDQDHKIVRIWTAGKIDDAALFFQLGNKDLWAVRNSPEGEEKEDGCVVPQVYKLAEKVELFAASEKYKNVNKVAWTGNNSIIGWGRSGAKIFEVPNIKEASWIMPTCFGDPTQKLVGNTILVALSNDKKALHVFDRPSSGVPPTRNEPGTYESLEKYFAGADKKSSADCLMFSLAY